MLFSGYDYFLNLGGIANISFNADPSANHGYIAFDVCPANRVLNMLANDTDKEYDADGELASRGSVHKVLLDKLNELDYYKKPYPKSLSNDFGTGTVYPLIKDAGCSVEDALRTYTEHIAIQVKNAIANLDSYKTSMANHEMLITGGGAFNRFLVDTITTHLKELTIKVVVPEKKIVKYKEAFIMALIGVLRWREENNVLPSVTGATRGSAGGALWMGQEE